MEVHVDLLACRNGSCGYVELIWVSNPAEAQSPIGAITSSFGGIGEGLSSVIGTNVSAISRVPNTLFDTAYNAVESMHSRRDEIMWGRGTDELTERFEVLRGSYEDATAAVHIGAAAQQLMAENNSLRFEINRLWERPFWSLEGVRHTLGMETNETRMLSRIDENSRMIKRLRESFNDAQLGDVVLQARNLEVYQQLYWYTKSYRGFTELTQAATDIAVRHGGHGIHATGDEFIFADLLSGGMSLGWRMASRAAVMGAERQARQSHLIIRQYCKPLERIKGLASIPSCGPESHGGFYDVGAPGCGIHAV